jgi:hypothetical protein
MNVDVVRIYSIFLASQSCFSKLSRATRLNASAATVLSRRGMVMFHAHKEQHQPVNSSPSTQIMRFIVLGPFAFKDWLLQSSEGCEGEHERPSLGNFLMDQYEDEVPIVVQARAVVEFFEEVASTFGFGVTRVLDFAHARCGARATASRSAACANRERPG